jgi:hypothetical protein
MPKMLEGLLDGDSFVSRTQLSAFDFSSVGSGIDRQTIELLAMSIQHVSGVNPNCAPPSFLDFKVFGKGAHGSEIVTWASIRAMS